MKVVLFCGGMGMRLREHAEALPEADRAGRSPSDPLACHEVLRPFRPEGLHPLPRATSPRRSRSTFSATTKRFQMTL